MKPRFQAANSRHNVSPVPGDIEQQYSLLNIISLASNTNRIFAVITVLYPGSHHRIGNKVFMLPGRLPEHSKWQGKLTGCYCLEDNTIKQLTRFVALHEDLTTDCKGIIL